MTSRSLMKTNLLVSCSLLVGFLLTAYLSHRAYYPESVKNIEEITSLAADGIYYQLSTILNKPVDVALTMANDTLLATLLEKEQTSADQQAYTGIIKNYLSAYHSKYKFDSIFLVSAASGRYYNFNGLDRTISKDNPENDWYYKFLESKKEIAVNVDNDEAFGADNAITVFINCGITNAAGKTLGVIGVGINVGHLKNIISDYEKKYNIEVFLIDQTGMVEISTKYASHQKIDWFNLFTGEKSVFFENSNRDTSYDFWSSNKTDGDSWYFSARYIPALSWHLVIGHNTSRLMHSIRVQIFESAILLAIVIIAVIIVITRLIKSFDKNITDLIEQRQKLFKKATEELYDNICEWNISNGSCVGADTRQYLQDIGAGGLKYDDAIRVIAETQIKEENRRQYVAMFQRSNVIEAFNKGNSHLQYDFQLTCPDGKFHWMRIDAHIFYFPEDKSLHMFTYHKNIDAEKQKELLANMDEMTHCYTKTATERKISEELARKNGGLYAFFIFDIDNFKHVNDTYGHAFGDLCIRQFSAIVKKNFRGQDIVGRMGGDEFAAFIPIPNAAWVREKAQKISSDLNFTCSDGKASMVISASIGIAIAPINGTTYKELYKSADDALYRTKQSGKNGFTFDG